LPSEILWDQHDSIFRATLRIGQHRQTFVERCQFPFFVCGQPEQITVRYLIMSEYAPTEMTEGILKRQIVGPKSMGWMIHIKSK